MYKTADLVWRELIFLHLTFVFTNFTEFMRHEEPEVVSKQRE